MGHIIGREFCQDHLLEIAKSIVMAIYKAPQVTGKTKIEAEIVWGEDLAPIIEVMEQTARIFRYVQWDYETIKRCYDRGEPPVIINIGASVGISNLGWNCGACGFDTCGEFNAYSRDQGGGGLLGGPSCNWKLLDWSIACDWACAAAWQHRVDNRIMGSVGSALGFLGFLPDSNVKIGLALGPPRDMVYYNREDLHDVLTYEMDKTDILRTVPTLFCAFPGGGNPTYKTKDEWWAPPDILKFEFEPGSMDLIEEALFQKIPEIVVKYSGQIEARYEKK